MKEQGRCGSYRGDLPGRRACTGRAWAGLQQAGSQPRSSHELPTCITCYGHDTAQSDSTQASEWTPRSRVANRTSSHTCGRDFPQAFSKAFPWLDTSFAHR